MVGRRQALTLLGGAALLAGAGGYASSAPAGGSAADEGPGAGARAASSAARGLPRYSPPDAYAAGAVYAPDGTVGASAAVPRADVRLQRGRFLDNQRRNLAYLLFLDPDRLLRSFRVNYALPPGAAPAGGWESPGSLIRGHVTGHLMSALAWAYAGTGTSAADRGRRALAAKGDYIVAELAALQARAEKAGFHPGYLSAFPEQYFTWLEQGKRNLIWSPYYMIHKYLAGLIDQYQLAGNATALDVAARLADWVDRRTRDLTYAHMQSILGVEFGGLPEALANLYAITGDAATLKTAERFYHARFLDPLSAGQDPLPGAQCNISTPKVIAALRLAEETGSERYWSAAVNFWDIATGHHAYAIGGMGNNEMWGMPDVVAGELSNYNCEGCVSYNMLKLTRLLHFHDPGNPAYMDYYERTLLNHQVGAQDPDSPHGFVAYYTGLSAGAHKQVPANYFPGVSDGIYATDYDTFTCDTATGLETPTRFTDSIYSRDADGALRVNLFVPSTVRVGAGVGALTFRQATAIPQQPVTTVTVESGAGQLTVRVRVPGWAAAAHATLNGQPQPVLTAASWAQEPRPGARPQVVEVTRAWRRGDALQVTFGMGLAMTPTPDDPSIASLAYGPAVLAVLSGGNARIPSLDPTTFFQLSSSPLTFSALGNYGTPGNDNLVSLVPVYDVAHQRYSTYWKTE
jgi:hypothetical protein